MNSKLQIRQDEEEEQSPTCPSCGADMDAEAVICLACGYDKRTGRRADEVPPPRTNSILLISLVVIIVAALAMVVTRSRHKSSPPPVPTPAPVVVAPAPAPAPEPVAAPTNTAPAVEAASTGAVPVGAEGAAVDTNAVPEEPKLDLAEVEAQQRTLATDQLNMVAPMFTIGESIDLRLTNGIIQRGILKSRAEDALLLEIASNDVRSIAFSALDRGTRVRSDPDFRGRYIDLHVRQRVSEIVKEEAAK